VLHLEIGHAISAGYLVPGHPVPTVALTVLARVTELAAVLLVVYLLARSGEGVGSIGLAGGRWRRDLCLVLPVWYLALVIPQDIGRWIVHAGGLPTYRVITPLPAPLLLGMVLSVVAGVLEEIVVLGYLVRRLEQRGWSPTVVVLVAVAVRVSYHVYYGPGVIPIVLWALATVLLYRRVRRLAPFIICHMMWDARIVLAHQSHAAANLVGLLFFVAALTAYLRWRRLPTPPDEMASTQGAH
jgi:membrane protease YdiL (CAAX protease family)